MLRSLTDAEDVVQEAFARLLRVDLAEIDDVRGWLIVVLTRLCLDQLRSARARHEAYVGPWLPEPIFDLPGEAPTRPIG
jgi:RNA polymerase sigma-70 factor (ECF subfamily)